MFARAAALALGLCAAGPAAAGCSFATALHLDALADIASVRRITVEAGDYRKWARNGLRIITSGSEQILERHKKKHDATLTVEYDFGRCDYAAEVRQNGDFKDHVMFENGQLLQSLNIKLEEGNVAGAVRFKLLLARTRNGDSEILGTTLLTHLGFLAPRTRFVEVVQNGTLTQMLWQEGAAKEFLEFNDRREGPLFEGDEALLVHWSQADGYAFEDLALARLVNDKWAARGAASLAMAADAFNRLQLAYADFGNVFAADPSQALTRLPLPRTDSPEATERWWQFAATVFAMRGSHGLRPHNRKFYWNAFLQGFEPIYYDGEIDIDRAQPRYLRSRDRDLYLGSTTPAMIDALRARLAAIEPASFRNRFAALCGPRCDPAAAPAFLQKVDANLLELRESLYEAPASADPAPLDTYAARYLAKQPDARLLEFSKIDMAAGTVAARVCGAEGCADETRGIPDLLSALSGLARRDGVTEAALSAEGDPHGGYVTRFVPQWNATIRHSTGARVVADPRARSLRLVQRDPQDWFLVLGGELSGVRVVFEGVAPGGGEQAGAQRFNAFGLTGCLTFFGVHFQNAAIQATQGGCEDSVNIVRGSGDIRSLVIEAAAEDALDIDFSELSLSRVSVAGAGNDCVDVSGGDFVIGEVSATACGDKAVSVGEGSRVDLGHLRADAVAIGVSSKDSSTVYVDRMDVTRAGTCYEVFRKKQEFFGAVLQANILSCGGAPSFVEPDSRFIEGARES